MAKEIISPFISRRKFLGYAAAGIAGAILGGTIETINKNTAPTIQSPSETATSATQPSIKTAAPTIQSPDQKIAPTIQDSSEAAAPTIQSPDQKIAPTIQDSSEAATPTIQDSSEEITVSSEISLPDSIDIETAALPFISLKELKKLPIIPSQISSQAKSIFQKGLKEGNNPYRFSKVGDCQNVPFYFLANFENFQSCELGEFAYLQDTINWYEGSFKRDSLATKGGLNGASMLSPLWADQEKCTGTEGPFACELRDYNSSIVLISLEESWQRDIKKYTDYLQQLIRFTIEQHRLPIIATKADNLEGGHRINLNIASLAQYYQIPLWHFWGAAQTMPDKGLIPDDDFHLTFFKSFDYSGLSKENPSYQSGWQARNLTALQTLDSVRRSLFNQ